jgi:hypothetical protein
MPIVPLKNVYEFERYLAGTEVRRPVQPQQDDAAATPPFGRVLTERQVAHRRRMLDFAMRLHSAHVGRSGRR